MKKKVLSEKLADNGGKRGSLMPSEKEKLESRWYVKRDRIFIELITSDRKLKASREGSK